LGDSGILEFAIPKFAISEYAIPKFSIPEFFFAGSIHGILSIL
jgi:hypothetical protein